MLECYYKKYLGQDCPGCGAQRSFIEMTHGNFLESLSIFPALIPLCFTFVFLICHLIFKYKHGAKVLIISFSISGLLMLVNFIYKIIVQ